MALEMLDKRAIIAYRLEKADAVMIEAKDNVGLKHWNLAAKKRTKNLIIIQLES
ncbi:MAG: hypothetical protein IKY72_01040 [Bacteroidaceae bacterium]|nr:hypothetical protein [Bacteroidaceae bacterium]